MKEIGGGRISALAAKELLIIFCGRGGLDSCLLIGSFILLSLIYLDNSSFKPRNLSLKAKLL